MKKHYLCGMNQKRLAIFASGNGSNALNIIEYFEHNSKVEIAFVLSNSAHAKVLHLAQKKGVLAITCSNDEVANENFLVDLCKKQSVDFIILAGFLRKIPAHFIQNYPERIINIHPSLLPKYGGKGMYGNFVHQAVIENKENETGITIHFVNEEFDKGKIIAQFSTKVSESDSVFEVQQNVQQLEHTYFAQTIEKTIL